MKKFDEDLQPENHCVQKIVDLLLGMDGMTNCMSLGILECVKQHIFTLMNEEDEDDNFEE